MTDKSYQPTIAGLRAFVAVAEKQHFGSAATALGVSQSTLSQALSALETGLGVQLVERSTRRVFLTGEGRQLLPHAQVVIEAATAFAAAAAGASDPLQGSIRLGLIPTVAPYVLPTLLAGLAERLPALEAALAGAPLDARLGERVEPAHLAPLSPIDDVRGSAAYRSDAVVTVLRRLLRGFAS